VKVTLVEDDPTIFSLFLTWLVTGSLQNAVEYQQMTASSDSVKDEEQTVFRKDQFLLLCKCWVLGDSLQADRFCNSVIDILIEHCKNTWQDPSGVDIEVPGSSNEEVSYVFKNTTDNSPLRRIILHIFINAGPNVDLNLLERDMPGVPDFYRELAVLATAAYNGKKVIFPWQRDSCNYHKHKDQPKAYSCNSIVCLHYFTIKFATANG